MSKNIDNSAANIASSSKNSSVTGNVSPIFSIVTVPLLNVAVLSGNCAPSATAAAALFIVSSSQS